MWLINTWQEKRARSRLDDIRVESLRFRRLMENCRNLLGLFADGEEKSRGDYIIDMHYVTSLVDQAIERASRLILDASVLAPAAGEVLFSLLDEQKKTAGTFHLAGRDREALAAANNGRAETLEPEYRLLDQVLAWFRGGAEQRGGERPLIRLLQAGVDHVMAQPASFPDVPERCLRKLPLPGHDIGMVFWEDQPGVAQQQEVSLAEVNCGALRLMVEGTEAVETSGRQGTRDRDWLAVVGENCLSLRSADGAGESALRVEAMASGHVDSDFVFLYVGCRHDLYDKLPPGLEVEETTRGRMGWVYDITGKELEEALICVGQTVFV